MPPDPTWTVRRESGFLVPGFTKRFAPDGRSGTTCFLGVPIGRFDVQDGTQLHYRVWPVVDVLDAPPPIDGAAAGSAGVVCASAGSD